jgi:hypothetical protein
MRALALAALAVAGACDRTEPIASCTDDLRGVYAVTGARWMVLDHRTTLEAYPLFDDAAGRRADGVEIAPRVLDLRRDGRTLAGSVRRRYLRGTDVCTARAPARVTRCAGDTLELVLGDPLPPLGFSPCAWPSPAPTRRERWIRQ